MEPITKYPLYALQDDLTEAFALNGFTVIDCEDKREMLPTDRAFVTLSGATEIAPIALLDGSFHLRNSLLPTALTDMKGALPLYALAVGRTYQKEDGIYPAHSTLEGVIASKDITQADLDDLFRRITLRAFGVDAVFSFVKKENGTEALAVTKGDDTQVIGQFGKATWLTKTILGTDDPSVKTYVFTIDVDTLAIHALGLTNRAALYDVSYAYLESCATDVPSYGDTFTGKVRNILRTQGYREFVGQRLYAEDCYKKMNMIQESWDTNNVGVTLVETVEDRTQLPTVLTPSLEEAMAANFKDGVEGLKIFEIGQIYKPPVGDAEPMDILSISFGAYGPDMDKMKFRADVDQFLSKLGISNHFFFPTTMAIAYDLTDCWLVLDEKPGYLGGNFGGISPVARANHGIEVPAWMCQLEVPLLEAKAASEYGFVPNELK